MKNKFPIIVEDTQSGQSTQANAVYVGNCGLFVESPKIFNPGTVVSCHLRDGEKTLIISGRVTWAVAGEENRPSKVTWAVAGEENRPSKSSDRRDREPTRTLLKLGGEGPDNEPPVPSGGMGIRFKDLSEADQQFLFAIKVGLSRNMRTVRMWLDGISDTVITQGIPTDKGVEVEAEIPFLKSGSSVRFSLDDERSRSQGKVTSVALDTTREDAGPLLRVALEMDVVREPTERTYFREEHVAPQKCDQEYNSYEFSLGNTVYDKIAPVTTFRPCVTRAEKPTRSNGVSYVTVFLITAVVSVWATWAVVDKKSVAVTDTKHHAELGTDRSLRTALVSSGRAIMKSASQIPTTIQNEAKQLTARRASTNKPIVYKYDKPKISVDEDRSSVLVPLTGSDEDIHEYQLSTPGIVVTLPHAQTLIPFRNYGIHQGLIKRVWVRPFDFGVQVRVITAWEKVRHQVRFTPDGLEVVLTP